MLTIHQLAKSLYLEAMTELSEYFLLTVEIAGNFRSCYNNIYTRPLQNKELKKFNWI